MSPISWWTGHVLLTSLDLVNEPVRGLKLHSTSTSYQTTIEAGGSVTTFVNYARCWISRKAMVGGSQLTVCGRVLESRGMVSARGRAMIANAGKTRF
jgi:hypothetical protein